MSDLFAAFAAYRDALRARNAALRDKMPTPKLWEDRLSQCAAALATALENSDDDMKKVFSAISNA